MTYKEYEQFLRDWDVERYNPNNSPYTRQGQLFFNMLYERDEVLANKLRGAPEDPFYNSNKLPLAVAFLDEIYKNGYESEQNEQSQET